MTQSILAIDPPPGNTVKENSFTSAKQVMKNLGTSFLREATTSKNEIKTIPLGTVECFLEIQLQDSSRGIVTIATTKKASGICETFSNTSAKDKTKLVSSNKRENERLEMGC